MKTLLLAMLLSLAPGGDDETGLRLYREGKFPEAVAAFRRAIEKEGDSAELQWNLALAAWRAGDLATAETAAEKYAALAKDARVDLHAGMLGAVRHDEAMALAGKGDQLLAAPMVPPAAAPAPAGGPPAAPEDPLPVFEQALQKATQARDHFVRGAVAKATPELLRNTERSLRTIDELQKKIDELKKQREEQKKDDEQKKPSDDDKKDEQKDEQKQEKKDQSDSKDEQKPPEEKQEQKQDEKKPESQEKKDDQQKGESEPKPDGSGEEKPEPKSEAPQEQKPEPKDGQKPQDQDGKEGKDAKSGEKESSAEPKPGEKRSDAPGENAEGKSLTPEQAQRLMEQVHELDQKQKEIRARAKSARRTVERDW